MKNPYFSQNLLEYLFLEYNRKNIVIVLFYFIVTLGFYALLWIYNHNKFFERIDEDAPDSKRGAIILFFIPIFLSLTFLIFKTIIFPETFIVRVLEVLLWSIAIFLTLKYLYEFCYSFAKFTNTKALPWYLILYIGYSSFILTLFGFYYGIFAIVFLLIGLMAMQEMINIVCYRIYSNTQRLKFNYMKKSNSQY